MPRHADDAYAEPPTHCAPTTRRSCYAPARMSGCPDPATVAAASWAPRSDAPYAWPPPPARSPPPPGWGGHEAPGFDPPVDSDPPPPHAPRTYSRSCD